jgi:predicted nucleotide-binding protein with TIR-like domain
VQGEGYQKVARQKAPEPEPIEVRKLSPEEIDRGISKIQRRIADIRQLETDGVRWNDGRKTAVITNVRETVREVFGSRSPEFRDFARFDIDKGGSFFGGSDAEYQACFLRGIPDAVALLDGLISRLEERKHDFIGAVPTTIEKQSSATSRKVFVVHGHDEAAKEATARFLSQLDLEPIILHEQPNQGRTIIEKFEKYADVSFAVILLTPDDLVSSKDASDQARHRARQNVIFELGFFVGKLSRSNVCALHKGDTEILSDYQGVLFVPMDSSGAWKFALAREIKAAGISIDVNRIV